MAHLVKQRQYMEITAGSNPAGGTYLQCWSELFFDLNHQIPAFRMPFDSPPSRVVRSPRRTPEEAQLRTLVSVNKRQLGGRDVEWMTLSTLRSFVVTFLFGRSGFELTSAAINPDRMPQRADTGRRVTEEEAREETLRLGRVLFPKFQHLFSRRRETVIGAPAVLAAIGAVAHRSASWSKEPRRTIDDFMALLTPVIWEKSPKAWDGVAGKITPTGNLSLAGGVKDNGSKTATALEDSTAESFGQIRGSHIYN